MLGKNMKKYILISDFHLNENNRGTAALGYGAVSFLRQKGFLRDGQMIATLNVYLNPFKSKSRTVVEEVVIQGNRIQILHYKVNLITLKMFMIFGILLPFSKFHKFLKDIQWVASINGGDGFSDIYGNDMFLSRLLCVNLAMKGNIKHIVLPQTLGPFEDSLMKNIAIKILKYSSFVFVRDRKFTEELDSFGIGYEVTKDLSAYMSPEPVDTKIKPDSVGINISGLAYSNNYMALKGQFYNYPSLINQLIETFQQMGKSIYLIPHSYNFNEPEINNDDLIACVETYKSLKNKDRVYVVNKDLRSPQIKYIISKMSFFIGTRMHANFAAIYTNVPVFGLAYSFKYAGAFEANGLSAKQTYMINNISEDDIPKVIDEIVLFYNKVKSK